MTLGFARHRAAKWLAFELFICALWLLAGWGELSASSADLKYEWYRFRYATSVFSAPFLLFTVAELVGERRWVHPRALIAFLAPYVVSLPFAVTLKEHGWLRRDLHLVQALGLEWWVGTPGPLAWVAMVTSYVADLVVFWLLARAIGRHRGAERAEFVTLFGVSLVPAALDLLGRFNVGPLPAFNLAPFALVPSFAAVVWMVARFDTFDVTSAMHTLLLQRIPSLVLVVDDGGLVLEANDAAAAVLGSTAEALRGRPTSELTTLFAGEALVLELGEGVERCWFRRVSTAHVTLDTALLRGRQTAHRGPSEDFVGQPRQGGTRALRAVELPHGVVEPCACTSHIRPVLRVFGDSCDNANAEIINGLFKTEQSARRLPRSSGARGRGAESRLSNKRPWCGSRLVQQPTAAREAQIRASRRVRPGVLPSANGPDHGGLINNCRTDSPTIRCIAAARPIGKGTQRRFALAKNARRRRSSRVTSSNGRRASGCTACDGRTRRVDNTARFRVSRIGLSKMQTGT